MIKEGDRLQEIYPGPNAEEIGNELTNLASTWHELKDATLFRRDKLMASFELQKFLSRVFKIFLFKIENKYF